MVDQTSQFYAILTSVGAAKQANADALGIAWKITHMAVGDGNPTSLESPPLPMPDATARALLNEWRRAPLNQLKVDDKDNSIIVAEQVIPADVGGRWIRELALFDADGDMVAVANCAPTYKPLLSQGSGRTQVVRMNLIVSSSSNVELKIDPSVVLATREWVTGELAKQDFKHSVLAATTAAITLSGLQTVDGVALPAGARVLVKNQAAAKDNGLYLVVAGGPWKRCTDADTSAKVTPGLLVQVEKGTANADTAWQLVTDAPITLGVSALVFEMVFGRTGVAAGTYRSVTVDVYGRVVAATNPTTVAGYGLTDVYAKTQIDQALALKAPVASPVFTGIPKVPTAAIGTNSEQAASTAFVQLIVASLINSAPGALDTLNEIAAAMGNDPNFAATIANQLALKAPLASPVFTGSPKAPTPAVTDNGPSLATTAFMRLLLARYGLGTTAYQFAGNIDQIKETGAYNSYGSTSGTRPRNPVNGAEIVGGMLFHVERDGANSAFQLWESVTTGVAAPAGGLMGLIFRRSRLGSGGWTAWAIPWDSLNAPRQATATDLTPEAILGPGSFGLGKAIVSEEVDMDKFLVPGNYLTSYVGLLNMPPGWSTTQRHCLVVEGLGAIGHMVQTIYEGLAVGYPTRMAVRTYTSEKTWTEWEEAATSRTLPFRGTLGYRNPGVFTWPVPAGVKKAWVTVIGGGGGGGRSGTSGIGSGGGGGGGLSQKLVDLTGVSAITVTVGAGGLGASVAGEAGGTGGTSSFGELLSATGGVGGMGANNVGANGPGASGSGSGGDFNSGLGVGHPSYGAYGGSGGGHGSRATQGPSGGSTGGTGGGGSGAIYGYNGGLGGAGHVLIQW